MPNHIDHVLSYLFPASPACTLAVQQPALFQESVGYMLSTVSGECGVHAAEHEVDNSPDVQHLPAVVSSREGSGVGHDTRPAVSPIGLQGQTAGQTIPGERGTGDLKGAKSTTDRR